MVRANLKSGEGHGPMSEDLIWMSATQVLEGYGSGAFSPVEVTQATLDRIGDKDQLTNAFIVVDGDSALAEARASEARWQTAAPCGKVDGVPTLVKDIMLTKGWPTLRGSKTVDPDQAWDEDAPAVGRMREHGAVHIGKTTDAGIRLERGHRLSGLRNYPQPLGSVENPRRLQRRLIGGAGRRHGAARLRHRWRRFDPHPRRLLPGSMASSRASAGCQPTP